MEPLSIIGLLASISGVTNIIAKSIDSLSAFKTKFRDAPFTIQILLGQLCTIRTALGQLKDWSEHHLETNARFDELSRQVSEALASFSPLVMSLQAQLDVHELEERRGMSRKKRLSYVWNERRLTAYFQMLDTQVNALTLLLQAVQCKTWSDQRDLLATTDSKVILRAAKDCASSVLAQRDGVSSRGSVSLFENGDAFSQDFEFDEVLLRSKVYNVTYRSHLKQVASHVKLPTQSVTEAQSSPAELAVNPFEDPPLGEAPSLPELLPLTLSTLMEESNSGLYDGPGAAESVATESHPVVEHIDEHFVRTMTNSELSAQSIPTRVPARLDISNIRVEPQNEGYHSTHSLDGFGVLTKLDNKGVTHYEFRYGIASIFPIKFFNQATTATITKLIQQSQVLSAKMIHFTKPRSSDPGLQVAGLGDQSFATALGWLVRYLSANPDWKDVPTTIPNFADRKLGMENLGMTFVVNEGTFQRQLIKATVTLAYKRMSVHRTVKGQWTRWPEILVWVVQAASP